MKAFIAIPSYTGTISAECMLSVVGLIEVLNSELGVQSVLTIHSYNGNVADARNQLVQEFLSTNCTHLLFVDDDMQFVPSEIARMFEFFTTRNEGVLAALCPRRNTIGQESVYDLYSPLVSGSFYGADAYIEIERVGTGIMLIPRTVFTTTVFNVIHRLRDGLAQYFLTISGEEDISEDYYFCDHLKTCGVSLYLALWTNTKHIGRYAFGGFKQ